MFRKLLTFIRSVVRRLVPYKDVQQVEKVETPLSSDMVNALDDWYDMYQGKPSWLGSESCTRSLGLPAFISGEIARQVVLELKWNITGKDKTGKGNADVMTPRATYLKEEFTRCMSEIRQNLEIGCASGGMAIKPYPKDGHIYFDWVADWSLYPIAFDDDGGLRDVVFRDTYAEGKVFYTRLERHTLTDKGVKITQRAFRSNMRDTVGVEIPLSTVPLWADVQPESLVENSEGQMFGWYRVAAANNIEVGCPMGVSVFSRAKSLIQDADEQYSRLMWEFEGSELAVDVDPTVLKPKRVSNPDGSTKMEMPKLNDRLFRGVDTGKDDTYHVFSPQIRDAAILHGLEQILTRIEDQCGMSRGSLTEAPAVARTATEMRLLRQRSYATVADNQAALERCLRAVIRAMDKYATLYKLAPEGEYDVSFQWDDSIITDSEQMMNERMILMNAGVYSKAELRQWYFGETEIQAQEAVENALAEQLKAAAMLGEAMPQVTP